MTAQLGAAWEEEQAYFDPFWTFSLHPRNQTNNIFMRIQEEVFIDVLDISELCVHFLCYLLTKMNIFDPLFGPFHCTRHKTIQHIYADPGGGLDRRIG